MTHDDEEQRCHAELITDHQGRIIGIRTKKIREQESPEIKEEITILLATHGLRLRTSSLTRYDTLCIKFCLHYRDDPHTLAQGVIALTHFSAITKPIHKQDQIRDQS